MTHQSFVKCYDVDDMTPASSQVAHRRLLMTAADLIGVAAAYAVAFLLRFDFVLDRPLFNLLVTTAPYAILTYAISSYYFGLNRGLRHYASFGDFVNLAKAVAAAAALQGAVILLVTQAKFPRSVLFLSPILSFLAVGGLHAGIRYAKFYWQKRSTDHRRPRTVVIVGAGDMGELVFRQMRGHETINYRILAFIDDDPEKWGMFLQGVPVIGGMGSLQALLRRQPVDEVVIARGDRRGEAAAAVAEVLRGLERRPETWIVPTLEEMLRSPKTIGNVRKIQPADLLNRKEIRLDTARITRAIEGKAVLVTGAGGTIGGELCRQAVAYAPKAVILLESHATALFYREAELKEKAPGVEVVAVLGDVRDQSLLERVFKLYRPSAVFHAAAHKHVHQLENNVQEGVSNNLLGTYHLAAAADRHGVEVFLLISTDKAVRPSCVMGATKRAAEMVVTDFARRSKTRFAAVRFGNVLGSSGSVLKIFQEQIEKGQPITVTHPDVTRYFMTVEEAVGLVLQAASMAAGGEIFVLNMGEPVRIMDMARNLALLAGLEPGRDVDIRITGLKPGEKLAEELVEDEGGQERSDHPDIMVLRAENKPIDDLPQRLLDLELASLSTDPAPAIKKLGELVTTFTAHPVHGERASGAAA